jgi:hypothetical protein
VVYSWLEHAIISMQIEKIPVITNVLFVSMFSSKIILKFLNILVLRSFFQTKVSI